jgi:RNA polymerase sigma-70 factor (ECF subfamily)
MESDPGDTRELLGRALAGDSRALSDIFARHRDRLRRMVEMRLDRRLRARIDASDVIQDAYLEVAARLPDYLRQPGLPLFLWLRLVVGERLITLHRHHLGTRMRDAAREVPFCRGSQPAASSAALADHFLGKLTPPADAAIRAERLRRVREAIDRLDPLDREVLSLRHFEQLSRAETAEVLGIREPAAAKRYLRALKRLKEIFAGMPGGSEGL